MIGSFITRYTSEVVTLWYRSPDILLGNRDYNTSVDMWSCGCIFAGMVMREELFQELYNSTPLFPGQNEADERDVIFKKLGTPTLATMPKLASYPEWNASIEDKCNLKEWLFPTNRHHVLITHNHLHFHHNTYESLYMS